jgi:hypothetical protein
MMEKGKVFYQQLYKADLVLLKKVKLNFKLLAFKYLLK